jgi:hypothetical protein
VYAVDRTIKATAAPDDPVAGRTSCGALPDSVSRSAVDWKETQGKRA